MRVPVLAGIAIASLLGNTAPCAAQPPAGAAGRPLQLATLQDLAIAADPRLGELQLQSTQSELRLKNIDVGRRPWVSLAGQTQVQSDVPTAPFSLPGGQPLFSASKVTYDAFVRIDQRIVDPSLRPQAAVERAQLAEQQARLRRTLFGLRGEVNDAFFAAASLEQRAGALAAAVVDLDARLHETTTRVREGAALQADAAAIEATLLERRQEQEELAAGRRAALDRLAKLTGQAVAENDVLVLPDLDAAVARAREASDRTRARPEYVEFARTRDRLARQEDAVAAQERPVVSAFGRVGYGRPGLNFIGNQFEAYGIAALQVQWKTWTWGTAQRERQALGLQQQIVAADEAAFTKGIGEATVGDLATIDRLRAALVTDDRIVALREEVDRTTRIRFEEGVVTASESLSRGTDLLQTRYARASHSVDLARASARFLTTLGLEVR